MKSFIKDKRDLLKKFIFLLFSSLFIKKANAYQKVSEFEKNTGFRNYGVPSSFEKFLDGLLQTQ